MKNSDRFLHFIYIFICVVLSGVFIVLTMNFIPEFTLSAVYEDLTDNYKWIYIGAAAIIIVFGLYLMFSMLKGDRDTTFGVTKYTSEGEVNISNETIKSLIMKTLEQVKGIKENKVWIKPGAEKMNILIKTYIMPDTNIPATVKDIQEKVRQYIEIIAEIPVGEIKVVVVDVAASTRLR